MENYMGQVCPHCNGAINPGENATVCPSCGVPHHLNCWISNQGCANPACPSKQPAQPAQPVYEQPAQPAPAQPVSTFCGHCGAPVNGGAFCPNCGQSVTAPAAPYGAPVPTKKKSKVGLIIGIVAAVVVVIILCIAIGSAGGGSGSGGLLSTGPNFRSLYNEYCSSIWADVGSDGSYLSIDTNPYNQDDAGVAYMDAYYAVGNVNDALGLPDSLLNDMEETRSIDGRQTRTYSDKNLEVTWTYHPDKGLEVTYRKIN